MNCDPPRISVITPSFNQARYLEETIQSVLSQGYPRLEYIVIDGGSTDESVKIIQRYSAALAYWDSEKDRGQSHAINKGFTQCTGELVAWLNSDDIYLPNALRVVGNAYSMTPGRIIAGPVINRWEDSGREKTIGQALELETLLQFWASTWLWHQPGIFFPRELLQTVGPLDESLHYAMDYDLVLRMITRVSVSILESPLVRFRVHEEAKGGGANFDQFLTEWSIVSRRYWYLAGWSHSDAHDSYLSYRFGMLLGQRIKRRHFELAVRVVKNAIRVGLLRQMLESFFVQTIGWLGNRLAFAK